MQLKTFQKEVRDRLDEFIKRLAKNRDEAEEFVEFRRARGQPAQIQPFCSAAWVDLSVEGKIPVINGRVPSWVNRTDGLGRDVPHVCIKVPTGGGKTLLACYAVGQIASAFMKSQAGLVLWVVPSDAILRQTLTRLSDIAHPYRLAIDAASGGRTRILRKGDTFSARDIAENLCVLVIMLQSTARTDSEALRVFRDTGGFSSFFPSVDDELANRALATRLTNLDRIDLAGTGIPGVTVRHSLANVLRLCKPILVVDEGHRAYTDLARDSLLGLNPSFLLELTATPNAIAHRSNVLVAVSGTALKNEEMIKLPINIHNLDGESWRGAVSRGLEINRSLASDAAKESKRTGRHIRPIMLVRVEATGRDRRDGIHIHADDVREYIETELGVNPSWIRTKTASVDELGDTDLLAPECEVRVILTKDALREGWDCPFAYVLVVLSNTTGATTITQMIGRVLRQPEARKCKIEPLNECYVVCTNQEVSNAVTAVRRGLEGDGMVDIAADVRIVGAPPSRHTIVQPNATAHPGSLILPIVGIRDAAGRWREFDPERDLLPRINWNLLKFRRAGEFVVGRANQETVLTVALHDVRGAMGMSVDSRSQELSPLVAPAFGPAVGHLLDVVPNAWQANRILQVAEAEIVARGIPAESVAFARPLLAELVRTDVEEQVDTASEAAFRALVSAGDIALVAHTGGPGEPFPNCLTVPIAEHDEPLMHRDGRPLQKHAFDILFSSSVNSLERAVIRELDEMDCVKWWHRVPVHQNWSLVGWRKNRIYPDLIAGVDGRSGSAIIALESKGAHLSGNLDTEYKRSVFEILGTSYQQSIRPNTSGKWRARILQDPGWEGDLIAAVDF